MDIWGRKERSGPEGSGFVEGVTGRLWSVSGELVS